jgi:hypothetical protein
LNLANAPPIPLAALDHAHDVAPLKGQKMTVSFLLFGCPVSAIRGGAAAIRLGTCPQARDHKTVFQRSRPSIPTIAPENAPKELHLY